MYGSIILCLIIQSAIANLFVCEGNFNGVYLMSLVGLWCLYHVTISSACSMHLFTKFLDFDIAPEWRVNEINSVCPRSNFK